MEHVQSGGDAGDTCLFEPDTTASHAKQALLLYRGDDGLCLLNKFPYANGHLLVAPVRHVPCLTELSPKESGELLQLVRDSVEILRRNLKPDGFNIGINIGEDAGAGIADHLHVHVVPRWRGDHNFMTVLADVRTIPEHLETTFDRLLPFFQERVRTR